MSPAGADHGRPANAPFEGGGALHAGGHAAEHGVQAAHMAAVALQPERGHQCGDVLVEALGDLVGGKFAAGRHEGDADALDDLVGRETGGAVAGDEVLDREHPRRRSASAGARSAPSATRHGSVSPIGEAVARLPARVPRLRIWREPRRRSSAAKAGK